MPMNCPSCGLQVYEHTRYCPQCGAKVGKEHVGILRILGFVFFAFLATVVGFFGGVIGMCAGVSFSGRGQPWIVSEWLLLAVIVAGLIVVSVFCVAGKHRGLRLCLVLDSAVLFLLGAVCIFAPGQVELAFGFKNLPVGVNYIIGLLGCVFATLAIGYCVAATDPVRHVAWVQVGIARGALEAILGIVYVAMGTVTFQQAGFGIVIAGLMAVAYLALYPCPKRMEEGRAKGDEGKVE